MSPDASRPHHERPEEQHERSEEQLGQRLAPGRQVVRGAPDPLVPERHPKLEGYLVLVVLLPLLPSTSLHSPCPQIPSCFSAYPASPGFSGAPAVEKDVQALFSRADRSAGLVGLPPGVLVAELEDEVSGASFVQQAGGLLGGAAYCSCHCTPSPPSSFQGVLRSVIDVLAIVWRGELGMGYSAVIRALFSMTDLSVSGMVHIGIPACATKPLWVSFKQGTVINTQSQALIAIAGISHSISEQDDRLVSQAHGDQCGLTQRHDTTHVLSPTDWRSCFQTLFVFHSTPSTFLRARACLCLLFVALTTTSRLPSRRKRRPIASLRRAINEIAFSNLTPTPTTRSNVCARIYVAYLDLLLCGALGVGSGDDEARTVGLRSFHLRMCSQRKMVEVVSTSEFQSS